MWGRMMAAEPTPEQKVARLFERLGGAAGPDDVRKALGDLGELASEQAMRVSSAEDVTLLLRVLAETEEVEVKRDVLDVLVNLLDAKTPSSAPDAARAKAAFNLDAFLEDPAAVSAVLSCLEPEDMYVRYNAIQLMLIVLGAERGRVQNFVLTNPMGAAAATELLGDRREVVRNDALLLLAELSKDSGEISRLIAFQGAFDRLLEIIGDEAEEGGSVIIDDCLVLIATLLRQNPAAQRLFVETGTLERLAPYLSYDPTDPFTARFAPKQLTASQVRICAIVTTIAGDQVGSGTDEQTLRACRDRLGVSGLVKRLVGLTTSSSTATEPSLRQAAMHSLACAVRAHEPNQRILIEQRVPVPPARTEPAPLRMLALALRGATRASAEPPLRVLLALLDGSSFAQLHLAATLAPIPTGLSLSAAAGSTGAEGGLEPSFCRSLALVLVGKTAPSPSQALLAAAVLSALVRGNSDSKQLLMRMAVEPSLDDSASDKGTDEIANSADSGTGGVSRSVGSAAAASVLGRACRRLPGVARPSAETVDDADADAPRAALTLALLRTLAAFADDGCLPAVKLILDWPGLLPSLVDVAKGGALPEGGQAGARPLPLAADFEAVMHIRGQASLVLARCLLSAEHAGTGLTAPALFDLLQQHLGLDTLLENLESVRSSPPNLKALSGSSFKSHTPSVGDKGAQPDPAALAGLSPLAAYAQADARALGKTTDSLQAVILRLYTAASAPPAPPHVALPIPATTLKPVEQPPPSPSFETAAQHAHISEPPPAPTLLKGEDVQAFKQQQPLFQSTQPAEANGLPSGAPGLLFPGLVPGPAQQAESGMESGSPMSERGTGVRDGAWDGDREGVREVDEEATREEHASDQQLIREQDSQLQSALHAANSSKSAADEALTSTAHHFADKRRASAAAVALAASLADADEELHVAIAAAAAAAATEGVACGSSLARAGQSCEGIISTSTQRPRKVEGVELLSLHYSERVHRSEHRREHRTPRDVGFGSGVGLLPVTRMPTV
mmetsp:Transcript_40700/g.95824  ORF Transcript_40700/g.95824 Transcript_40700/m.95824 type:complete len:1018 (-) Transcript_40700:560-3613(-)